jgi:hypothetical protein
MLKKLIGLVVGFGIFTALNRKETHRSFWRVARGPVALLYIAGMAMVSEGGEYALALLIGSVTISSLALGLDTVMDNRLETTFGGLSFLALLVAFWSTFIYGIAAADSILMALVNVSMLVAGGIGMFILPWFAYYVLRPEYRENAPRIPSTPSEMN